MEKYTCYCKDTFDGQQWSEQFDNEADARAYAEKTAGPMLVVYIDNPQGQKIGRLGEY